MFEFNLFLKIFNPFSLVAILPSIFWSLIVGISTKFAAQK
jgi:hypothetical protein